MSRKKFSDTGPFSLIPEWVLDLDVSDRAVRLYALLCRYADDGTGEGWPSRTTLAKRLRCSVDSLDRAKVELVTAQALEVEHRQKANGELTSNLYRILRVDPAAEARPLGTDAATWPQGDPEGGRTGAAENENQEPQPMNETDAVVDKWKPSESDLEVGGATIRDLRERHGFARRTA